jgi:flagellin
MLSIQTNVAALSAQNSLSTTNNSLTRAMERLSSGFRINRAADDAAGLAISQKMIAQIGGLNQAVRNANDGASMIQTAEGALDQVQNMMVRVRNLSVQAASDTNGDDERSAINIEIQQIAAEIDNISGRTTFNGIGLLDGSLPTATLQTGADATAVNQTDVDLVDTRLAAGTATEMTDLSTAITAYDTAVTGAGATAADARDLIDAVDVALNWISSQRAGLGAAQNRLGYASASLATTAQNVSAANSQIKDADVAAETASMSKSQILMQAGISVLAQANQSAQLALKLLNG